MRTFLETLKRVVDLLLQVAGVVVCALQRGAREGIRVVARAARWLGDVVAGPSTRWSLAFAVAP